MDGQSADRVRRQILEATLDPVGFKAAVLQVAPADRDAWLDRVLGLVELPDDGRDLPSGGVPYVPCSVDALLRMVEQAGVGASDVFVDVGAGLGRAAAFVHLLTGARVVGIEVQSALVAAARQLIAQLGLSAVSFVEGDAAAAIGAVTTGTVFFFYCPFSGERLAQVLSALRAIARRHAIRIGCLDLPLRPAEWLTLDAPAAGDLTIYRSRTL